MKNLVAKVGLIIGVSWLSAAATSTVAAVPLTTPTQTRVLAVSIDNDLFVPGASSDRDFTGGLAVTYTGGPDTNNWRPTNSLRTRIDQTLSHQRILESRPIVSSEIGFYGFTPEDVQQAEVVANDRPYASLIYISTSRTYPLSSGDSISTALTLGVLGSDIVGDAQSELHQWIGNDAVRGWHNQISDGGELTARYQIAHHHYWGGQSASSERFKTTVFSSVGYLTEAGIALSTRRGLISSPDHRFNPELISYGERVNETASTPYQGKEHYFWGGITLKARLYNAFLQGQFKHSAHTINARDLRPVVLEAWAGYTFTIGKRYKASYILRAQSSELKEGAGDRSHVWGGVVLSRFI